MTKTQTRMISWAGTYAHEHFMRPNLYLCVSSVILHGQVESNTYLHKS